MKIHFSNKKESHIEILDLLIFLNKSFVPYLEEQVDIEMFSKKLYEKAEIIFLIVDEKYIGIIAYYISGKSCFLTSFGIHKKYHKLGLGSLFFKKFIDVLLENKVEKLTLEVHITNINAINFYKKQKFEITKKDDMVLTATKKLNKG